MLDDAFRYAQSQRREVYLIFNISSRAYFAGIARMTSPVDWQSKCSPFDDRWYGLFSVDWVYVKSVPYELLMKVAFQCDGDDCSLFDVRDANELPTHVGRYLIKFFHYFRHSSSLLSNIYTSLYANTNTSPLVNNKPGFRRTFSEIPGRTQTQNQACCLCGLLNNVI